jgi:hypothetical protein
VKWVNEKLRPLARAVKLLTMKVRVRHRLVFDSCVEAGDYGADRPPNRRLFL